MRKAINDATLVKLGDLFQYYIALKDCFSMQANDKLQIEVNGDVSIISNMNNKSFQREVKHHLGKKKLNERDIDFWKTLSNWYVEYDRITQFSNLNLYTTATISSESLFYKWNDKEAIDKLSILQGIGKEIKEREKGFRKYYNRIFEDEVYNEEKLLNILSRFTIEHSQNQITGISKEFSNWIRYIPESNRDQYIATLLGQILDIIREPPHKWEISREDFDKILQQVTPSYCNPKEIPLPSCTENEEISEKTIEELTHKKFVRAIEEIDYKSQIPKAMSDYWKAGQLIYKYLKDDLLYIDSLPAYKSELKTRLDYTKENKKIEAEDMDDRAKIRKSKMMYTEVMLWEVKDFGSIIRNQGYFQRGIIHTIVDDGEFNWNIGEKNEY